MNEAGNKDLADGPNKAVDEAARKSAQRDVHLDERLDEALEETFPASDPVAVHEPRPDGASR